MYVVVKVAFRLLDVSVFLGHVQRKTMHVAQPILST